MNDFYCNVIKVETFNQLVLLTLNRPKQANTINREMAVALKNILIELDADSNIRVIVITGAGLRVFCGGLDLKERRRMSEEEVQYSRKVEIFPLFFEMERIETPIIAAVNGAAVGGGAELAMACDIRIASSDSSFGLPESGWGIIPAGGAIQRLPSMAGMGIAKEMILTGKIISAEQAEKYGIFNQLVEKSKVVDTALSVGREIAKRPTVATRKAKQALSFRDATYYGMWFDIAGSELCYQTSDQKKKVKAFGGEPHFDEAPTDDDQKRENK